MKQVRKMNIYKKKALQAKEKEGNKRFALKNHKKINAEIGDGEKYSNMIEKKYSPFHSHKYT